MCIINKSKESLINKYNIEIKKYNERITSAQEQIEYLNGKKHGKGKEIYFDGSVYEGDFKNGEKTGKGKFEDYEGNIYEGNFFNGYKHSIGKITFANGDVLEGLWMYDKIEGNAYFTSKDGKCYLDKYIEGQLIERKEQGFFNSFLK